MVKFVAQRGGGSPLVYKSVVFWQSKTDTREIIEYLLTACERLMEEPDPIGVAAQRGHITLAVLVVNIMFRLKRSMLYRCHHLYCAEIGECVVFGAAQQHHARVGGWGPVELLARRPARLLFIFDETTVRQPCHVFNESSWDYTTHTVREFVMTAV